jgi:predicted tellurium resistance membrane protein TerC
MTPHLPIMVVAVVVSMILMIIAATPLANFINAHPTIVMLALAFLLMIGMVLIAEASVPTSPRAISTQPCCSPRWSRVSTCLHAGRRQSSS